MKTITEGSIIFAIAVFCALASVSNSGEFSLQSQIDDAPPGSVIMVPQGRHDGPLLIDKALTLRGEKSGAVLSHHGDEPAVFVHTRNMKDTVLENLSVYWSPKTWNAKIDEPAAIAVRDSDAIIRNCTLLPIERPADTPYALLVRGRSNVEFTGGRAEGFAYTLMFTDGGNGKVTDSVLKGAGHSVVTMHKNSKVEIRNNVLADCEYHAVRNTGGYMDMTDNLVADNYRAGAYLGNKSAHGRIANNLFIGNRGAI